MKKWVRKWWNEEMAFAREEPNFFMIKIHPNRDLVMIQVGNNAIQLDHDKQKRVYNILKERLPDATGKEVSDND